MLNLTKQTDKIKIEGHSGTWYAIAVRCYLGLPAYLLEHEYWGDEEPSLIVDNNGNILLDDVWNGFDDLEEAYTHTEIVNKMGHSVEVKKG